MSRSKHSPGPWTVEVYQATTNIESKYQTVAVDVSNNDADLIAAAPDMLNALRVAVKRLEEITYQKASPKQIDFLQRVIAKAEGRK